MVREVRGAGTLVPEEIRWIPAMTSGRVERIVQRPGAQVRPGTVVIELSNPDLKQQVDEAELSWKAALAQLENQKSTQATNVLSLRNNLANAESALALAESDLNANLELAKQGIIANQVIKQKQSVVAREKNSLELARRQLEAAIDTQQSQLAPAESTVSQAKFRFDQLSRQLGDLQVKSDMTGVLQQVAVEVGQQIGPGTNLVRVSDPTRLKAEIRISETQMKDLVIGQLAKVDTRNGIVAGRVSRIDPSATNGTVGVDVILDDELPPGARPDQSVDGVIELQRLPDDTLQVESPAYGTEHSDIQLFKDMGNGEAERVTVKIGVRSVQFVQVLDGLQVGDRVILSDMATYDAYDRVRVN
jgi:HlyD family secretion protein